MTRSELVDHLVVRFPHLSTADVDFAVKTLLGGVYDALVRGDRVEIRGFGTFHLNYRPGRQGRNPKTGEQVSVPAKWVPHFKAGKDLRERVMEAAQIPPLKLAA